MTCTEALDLLLEAEPHELAGTTDSGLSRHLRDCSTCRTSAARILEAEGVLRQQLAATAPARSVGAAVELAQLRRKRSAWRLLSPLAAAAAAAAAALVGIVWEHQPSLPGVPPQPGARPPSLAITAPAGRNVLVMTTDNPDVVVFWFF
jgi:anti-sigma factor RsiW